MDASIVDKDLIERINKGEEKAFEVLYNIITRDLNTVGRIIIIIMMYCGRIGSMTFVLSFVHRPDKANIELPEEKVIIG